MIHYNNFVQILKKQNIAIQLCSNDQYIANDAILAYRINPDQHNILRYAPKVVPQNIYVFIESGAVCDFYFLDLIESAIQENNDIKFHIVLLQDAKLHMNFSFINIMHVDCSINIYLEGDRAKAEILGLYALNGDQKVSIQTYQYHAGIDTSSNLVIKGMLINKAQASYQGLIKIDEQAKRANASQENKNIVLSADARVISVPSIEVLQHDVQCCHGSAIGKFDKADLWYLQSKGIIDSQAQALLIRSFFQDVLAESENRDAIMDVLCQKMN